MYAYIPYAVLVATNAALIIFLTARQKKSLTATTNNSSKKSNANVMVVAITLLFVVLTFPATMNNIFYNTWIEQDWGMLVIYLCDSCDFTYHALSFPILVLTNKRFQKEFLAVIARHHSNLKPIRTKTTASTNI